jgi:hypothetical protein
LWKKAEDLTKRQGQNGAWIAVVNIRLYRAPTC